MCAIKMVLCKEPRNIKTLPWPSHPSFLQNPQWRYTHVTNKARQKRQVIIRRLYGPYSVVKLQYFDWLYGKLIFPMCKQMKSKQTLNLPFWPPKPKFCSLKSPLQWDTQAHISGREWFSHESLCITLRHIF